MSTSNRKIELLVTENKSYNRDRIRRNGMVRVFLNRDYNYGMWIDEESLFNFLDEGQQKQYLGGQTYSDCHFSLEPEVAQEISQKGLKF